MSATVLVVDDEERIRSSLRGILTDEGYTVLDTGSPALAMELVARQTPSLVLLDVWMPELDGIELLRKIKQVRPDLPVVMISGHANIQNAVAATRLGAADFIEKPFSLNGLLAILNRTLSGEAAREPAVAGTSANGVGLGGRVSATAATRPQKTLAQPLVIGGHGLHSGLKSGVILHPAEPDTGIIFSSLADQSEIPARLDYVSETGYNTTLSRGGHSIRTVEHLMSALHGLGVTNAFVKTDDEVPALDGSAIEFCRSLRQAGIVEQAARTAPIRVTKPFTIGQGAESIRVEPADVLTIEYTVDYPAPIGVQTVSFTLDSAASYEREIAPARTFGFVNEFSKMSAMGLARGGRLDNLILVDSEKIVNTTLRFADEFARHKILDLIGDLYLLGRPLVARIIAARTGHSDNLALIRHIAKLQ
ncbi:MAG TPA: UDP-3-O-acyl-N-acetylglucosamine deacetylase [Candidatus Binataceae bacterium]|nr:UDP-3-O-acyl-N-acetylglucosamine deacetylase [Candidatus Binataceae bacterium]